MAASTASRVSGRTAAASLSTRETVWCDTPARGRHVGHRRRTRAGVHVGDPSAGADSSTVLLRAGGKWAGRARSTAGPGPLPGPRCMSAITSRSRTLRRRRRMQPCWSPRRSARSPTGRASRRSPSARIRDGAPAHGARPRGDRRTPAGARRATAAFVDVVLGLAAASDYAAPTNPFLGSTVGRYANRIAGARFTLDGTEHRLVANEGDTCLHGGPGGFHSRQWLVVAATADTLELELVSPTGDQGFPGEVRARGPLRGDRRHGHHRAPGRDRHPHRRQPDQPHLLQPRRPRHGRRPPPRGGGRRVPPGRRPVDPHGLPRTGAGQPVRLPRRRRARQPGGVVTPAGAPGGRHRPRLRARG